MKQIIDNILYGYDPREFMPIRYDGKLENRGEFVAYKIKQIISKKLVLQ